MELQMKDRPGGNFTPPPGYPGRDKNVSKVKGQGHKVQKHIEGDQAAGVSYALYRVPSL